jgi:hypothetical protein
MLPFNSKPWKENNGIELVTASYDLPPAFRAGDSASEFYDEQQLLRGIVSVTATESPSDSNLELTVSVGLWYLGVLFAGVILTALGVIQQSPKLLIGSGGLWAMLVATTLFIDPSEYYKSVEVTEIHATSRNVSPVTYCPLVGLLIVFTGLGILFGEISYALMGLQIGSIACYNLLAKQHLWDADRTMYRHEAMFLVLLPLVGVSSIIMALEFLFRAGQMTRPWILFLSLVCVMLSGIWLLTGHELRRRSKRATETTIVSKNRRWAIFVTVIGTFLPAVILIALFIRALVASLGVIPDLWGSFDGMSHVLVNKLVGLPGSASVWVAAFLIMLLSPLLLQLVMWVHHVFRQIREHLELVSQAQRYSPDWMGTKEVRAHTAELNGSPAMTLSLWTKRETIVLFDTDVVDALSAEELEAVYYHEKYHIEEHHAWLLDLLMLIAPLAWVNATIPFFYPLEVVETNAEAYAADKTSSEARQRAKRKISNLLCQSGDIAAGLPTELQHSSETRRGRLRRWYQETLYLQYVWFPLGH